MCVWEGGGGENMADFLCLKETFFMLNSVEHEIFPAHKC